jgi:hypothetical protein
MSEMKVTSIQDLQKYAQGTVVELPPFAEGQPFVARLRRPSMMALVKSGKIPNSLLSTANSLFLRGGVDSQDEASMSQLFDLFDIICESCFMEPTYQQVKDSGIELTDDQYMFIFQFSQEGVKALESFRSQS